jgi:hypothetical protein
VSSLDGGTAAACNLYLSAPNLAIAVRIGFARMNVAL